MGWGDDAMMGGDDLMMRDWSMVFCIFTSSVGFARKKGDDLNVIVQLLQIPRAKRIRLFILSFGSHAGFKRWSENEAMSTVNTKFNTAMLWSCQSIQ